jgi:PhoPQ-activated pathogenicity-related protein
MTRRFAVCLLLLCGWSDWGQLPAEELPSAMFRYTTRPEPDFKWSVKQHHSIGEGTVHELHLVSQKWQGIVWEHALLVYEPQEVLYPNHMLIMVTGGRTGRTPKPEDMVLGMALANLCGARVASLHQVPNQPLLGDYVEDDLITETWLKYLETGDDTWPLLFPMVKSAVQAMTALEAFSQEQWKQPINGFVISGASKRGWTSWLTPVVDKRVLGTAPIVIDTLNFPVQMRHQLETWGKYSEQIEDYTRKGLVKPDGEPRTPREEQLWQMMDPYTYRSQLTLPKLMINGANDRYWVSDALKNYWTELSGPKHVLMVPNAGHGLDGGREGALTTLGVFFRHTVTGKQLPHLEWEHAVQEGEQHFTITTNSAPQMARLWTALSDSKDFRESKWEPQPLNGEADKYTGKVAPPAGKNLALFGELQFEFEGLYYSLTSRVFAE